jgi:hypothetical protein
MHQRKTPTFFAALLVLCTGLATATEVETLYHTFQNPPRADSLMPYWFWNGNITAAESRRQMREMIAHGVHQAVVFPWGGIESRSAGSETPN